MNTKCVTLLSLSCVVSTFAQNQPPFDFSDAFYIQNGINPASIVGRPAGSAPNSVIDNRENGPNFNNVRLLQTSAAYDHSGHPIFFVVTGLPTQASFLNNAAGQHALAVAEQFKVYEFPRASNGAFNVFPKRQDLIADLRNGYFGNDPLGTWQINIVRYTPAAFNTPAGREALADIADDNGFDLDGSPLIRTISEIQRLQNQGLVTITTPPANSPGVFRWFFCPVIEDPRDGAIASDAFLEVTGEGILPAAEEFEHLFHCLQTTGDDHCDGGSHCDSVDFNRDTSVFDPHDISAFLSVYAEGPCIPAGANCNDIDFNNDGSVFDPCDIDAFLLVFSEGPCTPCGQ